MLHGTASLPPINMQTQMQARQSQMAYSGTAGNIELQSRLQAERNFRQRQRNPQQHSLTLFGLPVITAPMAICPMKPRYPQAPAYRQAAQHRRRQALKPVPPL